MITTVGQLIVNEALPEEYRDYTRTMGKDEADSVLARIASENPKQYPKVAHALMQIGRNAAFDEGMTLSLADLVSPIERKSYFDMADLKEDEIDASDANDDEKSELKATLFAGINEIMSTNAFNNGLKANNRFALQVKSKARGSKAQFAALTTTPGTYSDHNGNMVPVFIRHSYAEGLDPEEYWSAAHGGRLGVLSTKTGTAKGGYLGKLLSAASMNIVVTKDDCGTPNGIPVNTDDKDNIGAVLARQAGEFAPGTVITAPVLASLKKQKIDDIVTRSVLTCSQSQGVCQQCAGKRENGSFPSLGYNLGQVAASALAEQVAQQALNCWAKGTMVLMSDLTSKPIEDIKVGDTVMGADINGHMSKVNVTNVFDNGNKECVKTDFSIDGYRNSGDVLSVTCTLDHKLLCFNTDTGKGYEAAKPKILAVGTKSRRYHAMAVSGSDLHQPISLLISNIFGDAYYAGTLNNSGFKRCAQTSAGMLPTFDIEVDNKDHLFVLANGLIGSNSKHSGKKAAGTGFSGFDVIKNLATAPSTYPDRASVAELDGVVDSITEAPQGGTNIVVNGQTHFALPGMAIYVKPGDTVNAGDPMSNGVVNPSDVVRLKGLGEGRRYFADRFTQAFKDSGLGAHRRNIEAVSRAIVNHVEIDDEEAEGDGLPGDTVTYAHWASQYKPRPDAKYTPISGSKGRYLEEPYLHYSIGTQLSKPVVDNLAKFGYDKVLSHERKIGVTPKFVSVIRTPEYMDDWMARLGSSYLDSRLLKDVHTGAESDIHGLHPLPGLARATEFGEPPKGSISPY